MRNEPSLEKILRHTGGVLSAISRMNKPPFFFNLLTTPHGVMRSSKGVVFFGLEKQAFSGMVIFRDQ